MKRYIVHHPEAGELQVDGSYQYRRGSIALSYLFHPELRPAHQVLWLTVKKRVSPWELSALRILRQCRALLSREGLAQLYHWRTGGVLLVALLLCWRFSTPETTRLHRWEWVVAHTLGLDPSQVTIAPGGWVAIEGLRKTAVDRASEPVTLMLHPLHWLAGEDHGYVIRYRGETYGYVTHAVAFDNRANIWLRKEGEWRSGQLEGDRVVWAQPEGTGVREGFVREQSLPAVGDLPGRQ